MAPAFHLAHTDAAVDRRHQPREFELQFCSVDGRLVGMNGGLQGGHLGLGRIHGLDGNAAGVEEGGVAGDIGFGVRELRLVLGPRGFGLLELRLEGAGIDLGQQLTGTDFLAFREGQLVQLAVDADFDFDDTQRLHRADAVQGDR